MPQMVMLNSAGTYGLGDYEGPVSLEEIVEIFSDELSLDDFRVEYGQVWQKFDHSPLGILSQIEIEYDEESDSLIYWQLIGETV